MGRVNTFTAAHAQPSLPKRYLRQLSAESDIRGVEEGIAIDPAIAI
ncbi:hypothetical protein NKH52_29400 [Mesorhizobium sp. M1066]